MGKSGFYIEIWSQYRNSNTGRPRRKRRWKRGTMSIRIQKSRCIGCARCIEACPGNLIKKDEEGKAFIRQVRDCWGCTSCIKECPMEAIRFFLGADMGGRGAYMLVKETAEQAVWTVKKPDGASQTIEVNKKDANKY